MTHSSRLPFALPAMFRRVILAMILLTLGAMFLGSPTRTLAHAELISADPPVDGLVVSSPDTLILKFTEEVERDSPAPTFRLLDESGDEAQITLEPVADGGDLKTVTIDVPEALAPGTWTLSWTLTSATDGHTISTSYAFRVGGGLPPGIATVEGEQPQAWAVATRWLTFIGAAFAAGGFLFGLIFLRGHEDTSRWIRGRALFVLVSAIVGFVATIIEPFLQTLFPGQQTDPSLLDAIEGMPDNWWFRPIALGLLLLLAIFVVVRQRGRIGTVVGTIGGALGLISLLGLALTSHSSGRSTWRTVAVASEILHQWSTALWVGGLAVLALWWTTREDDGDRAVPFPIIRFSSVAFMLFIVAGVTGLVNAGFVLPQKDFTDLPLGVGDRTLPAISKLWTSDYGIVLLVKSLVLILPFLLAAFHHQAIRRATRNGVGIARSVFAKTLRLESILTLAVVLGGSIMAMSAPPSISKNALENVTLAAFAAPRDSDPTSVAHLTVEPVRQGENTFALRLTTLDGAAIDTSDAAARVTLSFTSLNYGTYQGGVAMEEVDPTTASFTATGLSLSLDGWWQIDATIQQSGQQNSTASFYLLLPDPNVNGFSAPPAPDSDPEAEALFNEALANTTSLQSVQRDEYLGSGTDALVFAQYTWFEGSDTQVPAFEGFTHYSASFKTLPDGSAPRAPQYDSYHSVTIDGQSWQVTKDGEVLPQPTIRYQPPSEWSSTYSGAQEFQLGITQEIDGEECQIIMFHTPNAPGQSEAWFVWWVGTETGQMRKLLMIANQHYMVWHNYNFNEAAPIEAPAGATIENASGTPIPASEVIMAGTPVATPATTEATPAP